MALMRTSRKATTGPGDPKKKTGSSSRITPAKNSNFDPTVWTGKESVEEQWKKYKAIPNDPNAAGVGSKKYHKKASPEAVKAFNEQQRRKGIKLLATEIRYDDTDKALTFDDKGVPSRRLVDYANPTKDRALYEKDFKERNAETLKNIPVMKTRKAQQIPQAGASIMSQKKRTETVSKAIDAPKGKGMSFKNKASVTNRLKPQGTLAGGTEGRKFRKEEKLAGAYTRTKARAEENQGPRVVAGAFSKEKKAGYKTMRSDIRAEKKGASKLNVSPEAKAGYVKELKGALKDTHKSQKFEKKEQVGKTKYFTKSKMAETVKKTPSMKGRMQAGKMRYS